jgi:hypothetical protein
MELEHLRLTEVDAEGRIRASIRFDPDDRAEAFAEAYTRFAAGEAAGGGHTPIAAFVHAIARRDWEGMRRLCEGMSLHDHRPLSFGELRGEQWVESLRVQDELAPDWQSIRSTSSPGTVTAASAWAVASARCAMAAPSRPSSWS